MIKLSLVKNSDKVYDTFVLESNTGSQDDIDLMDLFLKTYFLEPAHKRGQFDGDGNLRLDVKKEYLYTPE